MVADWHSSRAHCYDIVIVMNQYINHQTYTRDTIR